MIYYSLTSLFELFSFLINIEVGFSAKMGVNFFLSQVTLNYIDTFLQLAIFKFSLKSLERF
jgi:hypothetical protein